MYENVGNKIKGLATFLCVSGIAISVILCAILVGISSQTDIPWFGFLGLIIGIAGTFISWVSSLMTVGFAELIIQTTEINRKLKSSNSVPSSNGRGTTARQPYGKCSVCGKVGSVTACKMGTSPNEYPLCNECLQKFKVNQQ